MIDSLVVIRNLDGYELMKSAGFEPLADWLFEMDNQLRREIIDEIFSGSVVANNLKFYRMAWDITGRRTTHWCSECLHPLHEYRSEFISHILSRGAHPVMAWDLRNFNIPCKACHAQWENATKNHSMSIFPANEKKIEKLKTEYYGK